MGIFNRALANDTTKSASYCTHVFSRACFQTANVSASGGCLPIYSLVGLDEPSLAVRCNPRLYSLVNTPSTANTNTNTNSNVLNGKYRYFFVDSINKILISFYIIVLYCT